MNEVERARLDNTIDLMAADLDSPELARVIHGLVDRIVYLEARVGVLEMRATGDLMAGVPTIDEEGGP